MKFIHFVTVVASLLEHWVSEFCSNRWGPCSSVVHPLVSNKFLENKRNKSVLYKYIVSEHNGQEVKFQMDITGRFKDALTRLKNISKIKKSKLFQIGQNLEAIGQKSLLIF